MWLSKSKSRSESCNKFLFFNGTCCFTIPFSHCHYSILSSFSEQKLLPAGFVIIWTFWTFQSKIWFWSGKNILWALELQTLAKQSSRQLIFGNFPIEIYSFGKLTKIRFFDIMFFPLEMLFVKVVFCEIFFDFSLLNVGVTCLICGSHSGERPGCHQKWKSSYNPIWGRCKHLGIVLTLKS